MKIRLGESFINLGLLISAVIVIELFLRLPVFSALLAPTPAERLSESLEYAPALWARHVFSQAVQEKTPSESLVYRVNSNGYRGEDISFVKKSEDEQRIMIYGGSAVFDIWNSEQDAWPFLLQEVLRDKSSNSEITVINAGIPGHASFDSVGRLFSEGHHFKPNILVLSHGWNDIKHFQDSRPLLRRIDPMQKNANPFIDYQWFLDPFLSENSVLYALGREALLLAIYRPGLEPKTERPFQSNTDFSEVALEQFELSIRTFIDVANSIAATPVLMIQPRLVSAANSAVEKERIFYQYVGLDHNSLVRAFEVVDNIKRKIAVESGALLVDPSMMTGKIDYFNDHVHTNKEGSRVLAEILASQLNFSLNPPQQ